MNALDETIDFDTVCEIIVFYACSKGGQREKDIKRMVKELLEKALEKK